MGSAKKKPEFKVIKPRYIPEPPRDAKTVRPWKLSQEKTGYIIRRYGLREDGSRWSQRFPPRLFKDFTTKRALEDFVIRLNGQDPSIERARQRVEYEHAFINQKLMDDYLTMRLGSVKATGATQIRYKVKVLRERFLDFFLVKHGYMHPMDWYKHQEKWGEYLLGLKIAPKTIREWVQEANQFIRYLHRQRPQEVPLLTLQPVSEAKLSELKEKRKLSGEYKTDIGKFIKAKDWRLIRKKMPKDLEPFVLLAFLYGLRKAEALGVVSGNLKKGYLSIVQQLERVNKVEGAVYGPPKTPESVRKIPHWFAHPRKAYRIIQSIEERMHPDTFGKRWTAYMNSLGLDYETHDMRRTFITRALRKQVPIDVKRAAGHVSIETTMGYLVDDRDLDDELFVPDFD